MADDALFLTLLLVLPFVGSLIAAFLPTNARNAEAWLAGAITLACLLITLVFQPAVAAGRIVRAEYDWLPQFGFNLLFRLDGLAWAFTVLITGIGALIVLYARYYMSPKDPVPRFFSYLLAFMGAMLGIVLSGNLVQIVLFWELTSLFSFLLIAYWHHVPAARDGARISLTVTAAGGLCLFAGVMVIGHIVGSYDLDVVLAAGDQILDHPLYPAALILVLLGALTKSAQFPFQFWLPRAMTAPTPVSAYLHSATMVKAGVFLLARLWPVMAGHELWFYSVAGLGAVTLLIGAFMALFQQDLKGLLAYSTVSHLGLVMLLLGLGTPLAAVAAIFHMMNHATFKASLFMAAGIIDHETGTRDIRRLGGLVRSMPLTAALAMVAAAAMAGVPLLNGFLSKEMFFTETVEHHDGSAFDAALPYIAILASMFSVAYSLRLIDQVFFGPPAKDLPRTPHEPVYWMLLPIALLVLICLLVGIFPTATVGTFLAIAVHGALGPLTPTYSLSIWHGFNTPFVMSVAALIGGVVLYFGLKRYLLGNIEGAPLIRRLEGKRLFQRVIVVLSWRWARAFEEIIGTGRLQSQLRLLAFVMIVAGLWAIWTTAPMLGLEWPNQVDPVFALVWLVGGVCAVGAAYQAKYHRLASLVLMGGAGLATCLTFAWFSAPDLAVTQLLVEIVTAVLILLGLRWLPKRMEEIDAAVTPGARIRRVRDFAIAIGSGLGLAVLAYAVMMSPVVDTIALNFLQRAYSEGGGTNVVNVILVDFRGFDTLGEIAVLGVAAITVYALLRRFRPARDSVGQPEQQRFQNAYDGEPKEPIEAHYMLVPGTMMRVMFPVLIIVAMFLLLRGHDLPGGGFVAGLVMAIAFILQYMAGGARWVEARLRILPARWIGSGLLLAFATGVGSIVLGYPFLTSYAAYVELPVVGSVPMATGLLFDFGVFALVVGATVLMLIVLAHQSLRTYREPEAARRAEPASPAPDPATQAEGGR